MPEGSAPERRSPVARVNRNSGKDAFVDAFAKEGKKYGEGAWNVPPPIGIREKGVQKNVVKSVTKKEVKAPPPLPPVLRSIKAQPKAAPVEDEPMQLDANDLQHDDPVPAEPPQEKGIVLRRPEPVASRPYIGDHTPERSSGAREQNPSINPRLAQELSIAEARVRREMAREGIRAKQETQQEAWVREAVRAPQAEKKAIGPKKNHSSGPEKSHASIAIEGLGRELDGLMDLAKRYRIIYGGEIYDEAKEGTQHRIADSFMGRIGRWFTRDDGKNKAREEAASSGFGSAKAFQGEWKKQLQALDARAATFKGNTLVIRDRLHEILKIPMQEKAQAAWNALYENLLDLTVLAPVTTVVDTYKEARTTARNQERTQAEAMARRTNQLAERILTGKGFEKTRGAVAAEFRKNVEDIEVSDVVEFLYTTSHGQKILEIEQERAIASGMKEGSRTLYEKIDKTEGLIRSVSEMQGTGGYSEIFAAVEGLKSEVDRVTDVDDRKLLTKRWNDLNERAAVYYEQKGRAKLIEDASAELGKVEAVVTRLLERSQSKVKMNFVDNRELFLEDVANLLPEDAPPVSIKEVKNQINALLKETSDGLMSICVGEAKEAAAQAQFEDEKMEYIHNRIAFITGGKDGPEGPIQRAAAMRETALLQKTGALNTEHLEAEVLLDVAELYEQLTALQVGSEKKDASSLIDVTDRLRKELSALDSTGKAEAYLLGGGVDWNKVIFGGQLGEELGQKVIEDAMQQSGDQIAALKELNQTKAAWLVGRKLLIHTDTRLPDPVIRKKISKELPDAYKHQVDMIFAELQA